MGGQLSQCSWRTIMKFQFNEYTDQMVGLSREWYIVYRLDRFYLITRNHNNLVANCGSLEAAMELADSIL